MGFLMGFVMWNGPYSGVNANFPMRFNGTYIYWLCFQMIRVPSSRLPDSGEHMVL